MARKYTRKQRRVRWADVPMGGHFRFWGSDMKGFDFVKVGPEESISTRQYAEFMAALQAQGGELPITPEVEWNAPAGSPLRRLISRPDRDEWYSIPIKGESDGTDRLA